MGSWEAPVPLQLMDVKMWSAPFETLSVKNTNTQLKYSLY